MLSVAPGGLGGCVAILARLVSLIVGARLRGCCHTASQVAAASWSSRWRASRRGSALVALLDGFKISVLQAAADAAAAPGGPVLTASTGDGCAPASSGAGGAAASCAVRMARWACARECFVGALPQRRWPRSGVGDGATQADWWAVAMTAPCVEPCRARGDRSRRWCAVRQAQRARRLRCRGGVAATARPLGVRRPIARSAGGVGPRARGEAARCASRRGRACARRSRRAWRDAWRGAPWPSPLTSCWSSPRAVRVLHGTCVSPTTGSRRHQCRRPAAARAPRAMRQFARSRRSDSVGGCGAGYGGRRDPRACGGAQLPRCAQRARRVPG